MATKTETFEDYIATLPEDRQGAMSKLLDIIRKNIPDGFEEGMSYGMHGWVVPHSKYPAGYHCKPEEPLPFLSMASQKNFIGLYHMGVYADEKLLNWFQSEYPKHAKRKLDMGKSCIRFKKMDDIPFDLIGKLVGKMTADEWIKLYEKNYKK